MKTWRCFHCDAVFRSPIDARRHFGGEEASTPTCLIKAAGEDALLDALRDAEEARRKAWDAVSAEDTDAIRAMHAMRSDYEVRIRDAEQRGYDKGLLDGRKPVPTQQVARGYYVASRASIPERSAMWRAMRDRGMHITSSWIDEAGAGETKDLGELWERIAGEIMSSEGIVLYARPGDFPLKGALVECGIAIGLGKPVGIVMDGIELDQHNLRPLGSWARHSLCFFAEDPYWACRRIQSINAARRNQPCPG